MKSFSTHHTLEPSCKHKDKLFEQEWLRLIVNLYVYSVQVHAGPQFVYMCSTTSTSVQSLLLQMNGY